MATYVTSHHRHVCDLRPACLFLRQKQLDRGEKKRAQAEKGRLRKLMLDGVITADDLRSDPCMLEEYQQHLKKLAGDKRRGTFVSNTEINWGSFWQRSSQYYTNDNGFLVGCHPRFCPDGSSVESC